MTQVQFGAAWPFGSCERSVRSHGRILTCGFPLKADGTCTSPTEHLAMACPDCPVCGQPPRMIIGETQAVCGNDDCQALLWNPSISHAENIASLVGKEES